MNTTNGNSILLLGQVSPNSPSVYVKRSLVLSATELKTIFCSEDRSAVPLEQEMQVKL